MTQNSQILGSCFSVVAGCGLTVGLAKAESIVRLFIMLLLFNDEAFVINIEFGLNSTSSISSLVTIRLFFLKRGATSLLDSKIYKINQLSFNIHFSPNGNDNKTYDYIENSYSDYVYTVHAGYYNY